MRAAGGDGIGNSAPDVDYCLELRHFRNGTVSAIIHRASWHQNHGSRDNYCAAPVLLECATVEQIIVELKGFRGDDDYTGCDEPVYSDRFEEKLTTALVKFGMPEMEPAPDDEDPETAC